MSEIKRCENCGNEKILIINHFKGHYVCGKCGRDTEKLYEIEHDAEIRAKTIDEFVRKLKRVRGFGLITNFDKPFGITFNKLDEIAEELRGDKNQKNK